MAQFQKTTPRKDTVSRRPLTKEDIAFLTDLQSELNTQDTMGNRDPRFWVIRQTEEFAANEDTCDRIVIVDDSDGTTYDTVDEFIQSLSEDNNDIISTKQADGTWILTFSVDDGDWDEEEHTVSNLEDAVEILSEAGYDRFRIAYVQDRGTIVPDTLFLTHRECEDHLRKYGYNYHPDAHAYAMTAVRSPQFERLLTLLQSINWNALSGLERKEE